MGLYITQNGAIRRYKKRPNKKPVKPKEQINPNHQQVILKMLDKYSIRETIKRSQQLYIYNGFTIQHLISNYLRNKQNFYEQTQDFLVRIF
jgi:hypothetical protein